MLYALVFCALLALASGTPNRGLERITGSTLAVREQFPFVVAVALQYQLICSGVIYNDRWIVTTAKCVVGKPISEMMVLIGALSLISPDPGEQLIEVLNIVEFSQFDPFSLKHDIALLELSQPIVLGPTAQPIRYGEIDELALPWDAAIAGWGATFDEGFPSTKLRWAPIDDLAADCGIYDLDEVHQTYTICAGSSTGTISPCEYDEGSPLVQKTNSSGILEDTVVGIMSKNNGCADLSLPTVYTRLATYSSWLLHFGGPQ